MIDLGKAFGTKKDDEDKDKPEMVYFKSKEEAERETGYFKVWSIQITPELADSIFDYVRRTGIRTYARENKKKTAYNHYTLKFIMRNYYVNPQSDNSYKYCWIERGGAEGIYSSLTKSSIETRVDGKGELIRTEYSPSDQDVFKYDLIKSKTPDLNQLYFWICRKYPSHLKSMTYDRIRPSYLEGVEAEFDDYNQPLFDTYPRD
ncbi:hypothetical protein [Pseudomonas caricapapayae]|uniref:hypothetical protein n=1 Tax=Pseudomonas caricapapayae TaxID=46678 RepID=UPI000EFF513E|nr:hypothetical protein [Pseudomonas caricapapayae]